MKKLLLLLLLCPLIASAQLTLPYSIKINNAKPLDYYYYESDGTPYDNTTEVTTAIPSAVRYQGMTVNVVGVEYWFGDGITDGDLEVKIVSTTSLPFSSITSTPTTLSGYGITDGLISSATPVNYDLYLSTNQNIALFGTTFSLEGVDHLVASVNGEGGFMSFSSNGDIGFSAASTMTFSSPSIKFLLGGSDATGDMYYRNSSGSLNRLASASTGNALLSGTTPSWGKITSSHIDATVATAASVALKQDVLTGLTSSVAELNYTDGVTSAIQTQIDTKLKAASTASTGTDVAFDIPRTYGYAADATGNITFTTTGLVEGITQLMIHNDSSEPTFETGMVVISGTYVTGEDNYIMFHAVKSSLILVTISQAQ